MTIDTTKRDRGSVSKIRLVATTTEGDESDEKSLDLILLVKTC